MATNDVIIFAHKNDYSDWSVGGGKFARAIAQQVGPDAWVPVLHSFGRLLGSAAGQHRMAFNGKGRAGLPLWSLVALRPVRQGTALRFCTAAACVARPNF